MGIRVGITIVGSRALGEAEAGAGLWSSGLTQNIVFLALLMQRLPEVDRVVLVACPAGDGPPEVFEAFGLDCIGLDACAGQLDLMIELGARGGDDAMAAFRAAGGKLVSYVAGNVMAMNFEQLSCSVPHGELLSRAGFDAVWITPQHWRMNRSYAAITRSRRVAVAPHIWAPDILLQAAIRRGVNLFYKPTPDQAGARIGVFDPNVNVVKTFHIPLLVCEEAYRQRPSAIDRVLLFSAAHLKGIAHVEEFIAATDLGRAGKVFVEHRLPLPDVLGVHVDVVVTHQWENNLNYLYWDTLYAGYPLIHNADPIRGAGYYYEDFDPKAGARALLEALDRHGTDRACDRPGELAAVHRVHIDNLDNQRAYSALIADVMALH